LSSFAAGFSTGMFVFFLFVCSVLLCVRVANTAKDTKKKKEKKMENEIPLVEMKEGKETSQNYVIDSEEDSEEDSTSEEEEEGEDDPLSHEEQSSKTPHSDETSRLVTVTYDELSSKLEEISKKRSTQLRITQIDGHDLPDELWDLKHLELLDLSDAKLKVFILVIFVLLSLLFSNFSFFSFPETFTQNRQFGAIATAKSLWQQSDTPT
jgi:competence protein ComGC